MNILILKFIVGLMCTCGDCVCDDPPGTTLPYHPSCQGPQSYSGGNLWKPRGDHSNNLVVLLKTAYPIFDFCEVRRKDGTWEVMGYTGLSNGDRQTYRGPRPGGDYYAGKMKNGGVRCFIGEEFCEFPIPGPPKERHD